MRPLLRFLATRIDVPTYERLMAHSVLKEEFSKLGGARQFEKREALWEDCLARQGDKNRKLTYVEFGVHTGYSIKYIAARNTNPDSVFIGLDSFEGLTNRIASGGQLRSGSPHAANTHRDPLPPLPDGSISRSSFFEGREFRESLFDERELAANCLFLGLLLATALCVLAVYVGYQAFIF